MADKKKIVSEDNLKHFKEQCDAHYGTFKYEQNAPAKIWEIQHSMNRKPSVTVIDSFNNELIGDIVYVDENNLKLSFSGETSGVAYLT